MNTTDQHKSMEEVAQILGISRARVMQIEHAALKKLAKCPVLRQLAEDLRDSREAKLPVYRPLRYIDGTDEQY